MSSIIIKKLDNYIRIEFGSMAWDCKSNDEVLKILTSFNVLEFEPNE